jgi:hypothetical protein
LRMRTSIRALRFSSVQSSIRPCRFKDCDGLPSERSASSQAALTSPLLALAIRAAAMTAAFVLPTLSFSSTCASWLRIASVRAACGACLPGWGWAGPFASGWRVLFGGRT